MNTYFKKYFCVWAVLLALFNVIAFVSVSLLWHEKYTPAFWIGYISVTLAFAGHLACAYRALKAENATKLFYSLSIVKISYSGLIASFVFGGLCMALPFIPWWVATVLCAIVLAVNVMAVIKASMAIDAVTETDKKVQIQTFFIKSLTADAETLMARAESEALKAECRKVYEAIRYSDPMSSDALAAAESQITLKFAELSDAVKAKDLPTVQAYAREVVILVEDRNRKCKLLK